MHQILDTDNEAMCLHCTITCKGKKKFRVWAEDYGKKFSKYADRIIEVDGKRTIFLSFPVSPRNLFIGCLNSENPKDEDFTFDTIKSPLRKYNIYMDSDTKDFVQLALNFSQRCGFDLPPLGGNEWRDQNGLYRIKYVPIITDGATGTPLSTPARIGHSTGTIEISARKFVQYTIPMRMMILLHEFSHKYKNPKIGLKISNEFGADVNGLYIYLGMGFSKIDAILVFSKIFLAAQTPQNQQRMRKVMEFIAKFEAQEFAEREG